MVERCRNLVGLIENKTLKNHFGEDENDGMAHCGDCHHYYPDRELFRDLARQKYEKSKQSLHRFGGRLRFLVR